MKVKYYHRAAPFEERENAVVLADAAHSIEVDYDPHYQEVVVRIDGLDVKIIDANSIVVVEESNHRS